MIAQDSIEALKSRLDIVDVVGSYIELKKAGANFKAPCPFHNEKTASFVVSPAKQIFHCFGCGAGGDSVKFVMDYEKLNYPEALEKLAHTYNFTLNYTNNKHNKPNSKVMEVVNSWYIKLLTHNDVAKNYLLNRGVSWTSIEKFGIGYAPTSNETVNFINSQMLNMNEAIESGVVGFNEERKQVYARFIERITFPIHSPNGTIVGFGGRTITNHQAKYVNSPETKFFNKSRLLYAYHHARQEIYKKEQIIITEGYLDVVMLHQAGFINAVATLGTALTNEHIPLLKKGSPKVIVAYDGDKAGRNAGLKASKILSVSGFSGGIVLFEEGKDPADMVASSKIEELNNMFLNPKPFIEFVLDEILALYNLNDPKEKEKCMYEGTSYLKTLSPILQEEYKTYLASRLGGLGVSPSLIKLTPNTNRQITNTNDVRFKDILELSLIKTILEKPEFIDLIVDLVDETMFSFHSQEFALAIAGEQEYPQIMSILLDDTIKSLEDEQSLKSELNIFLIKFYERALKQLNFRDDLDFMKKAQMMRKYKQEINRLKSFL